ncbi:MAG TPA: hybrid sensor histidine kinase/response regulator, partial [Flexistipes sinusarabici]|nr:hybrid sensor histidine kinase/response regulator [Flexistipes sinusarabici]
LITLRSIGDGVIVTDYNQNVEMLNDVAVELTGYSEREAKGRHIKDIFHIISEKTGEEIENPVEKCMETKSICQLENHTLLINKDEYPVVIADSAAPIIYDNLVIGAVLVFRDETEKRQIQSEMIKKQKLESVGVLAGGIAHDFNNILTAMSTYNTLLDMSISEEDKEKKYVKNMSKLISRAEFLSNRLLTFAKGGTPVKQATDVYSIIKETIDFVLAGTEIDYVINESEDLWKAEADPNQIAQVFHNILINARHAIDSEGLIKVNLENKIIEKDTAVLQKGKYVLISIEDNGKGISKEHLERIFEPFYTSKSDGSGLGLSIAYSVVKNHDGHIYVESEEGKGTIFYIYLKASG